MKFSSSSNRRQYSTDTRAVELLLKLLMELFLVERHLSIEVIVDNFPWENSVVLFSLEVDLSELHISELNAVSKGEKNHKAFG